MGKFNAGDVIQLGSNVSIHCLEAVAKRMELKGYDGAENILTAIKPKYISVTMRNHIYCGESVHPSIPKNHEIHSLRGFLFETKVAPKWATDIRMGNVSGDFYYTDGVSKYRSFDGKKFDQGCFNDMNVKVLDVVIKRHIDVTNLPPVPAPPAIKVNVFGTVHVFLQGVTQDIKELIRYRLNSLGYTENKNHKCKNDETFLFIQPGSFVFFNTEFQEVKKHPSNKIISVNEVLFCKKYSPDWAVNIVTNGDLFYYTDGNDKFEDLCYEYAVNGVNKNSVNLVITRDFSSEIDIPGLIRSYNGEWPTDEKLGKADYIAIVLENYWNESKKTAIKYPLPIWLSENNEYDCVQFIIEEDDFKLLAQKHRIKTEFDIENLPMIGTFVKDMEGSDVYEVVNTSKSGQVVCKKIDSDTLFITDVYYIVSSGPIKIDTNKFNYSGILMILDTGDLVDSSTFCRALQTTTWKPVLNRPNFKVIKGKPDFVKGLEYNVTYFDDTVNLYKTVNHFSEELTEDLWNSGLICAITFYSVSKGYTFE